MPGVWVSQSSELSQALPIDIREAHCNWSSEQKAISVTAHVIGYMMVIPNCGHTYSQYILYSNGSTQRLLESGKGALDHACVGYERLAHIRRFVRPIEMFF